MDWKYHFFKAMNSGAIDKCASLLGVGFLGYMGALEAKNKLKENLNKSQLDLPQTHNQNKLPSSRSFTFESGKHIPLTNTPTPHSTLYS